MQCAANVMQKSQSKLRIPLKGVGLADMDAGSSEPDGAAPARYLAIHPPRGLSGISEKVEDRARDHIEYLDEDAMIRRKFERSFHRGGLASLMPEAAYRDRDYEWNYTQKLAS
jgi:hypothetical protein